MSFVIKNLAQENNLLKKTLKNKYLAKIIAHINRKREGVLKHICQNQRRNINIYL